MCTHKITGEFYIGYRHANKLQSHLDLVEYKTSSKLVKPRFCEFDWLIIAEFFSPEDAYDFEQLLIYENWKNALLLNKSCYYGGKRFMGGQNKGVSPSKETILRMSLASKGRIPTEETRIKQSNVKTNFSIERKEEIKRKQLETKAANGTLSASPETRAKQLETRRNKTIEERELIRLKRNATILRNQLLKSENLV
jgi:hypothetical protein